MTYSKQVADQQTALNQQYNAGLKVDGLLGPLTQAAITKYTSQTLTQGQSYMGGTVNYDTATGAKLATGATTLSSPIPPSNAGNIVQGGAVKIPNGTYDTADTSGANSAYASSASNTANEQKQIDDFYAKLAADQKANSEQNKSFLTGLLGSQKSATTMTAEEEARFGVDAKAHLAKKQGLEASYASLEKDYTNAKNAMEEEKMAATDRLATVGNISSQQNAIERKYSAQLNRLASELNYKGAEIARENGNYNEAEALVQKAVNLKLADQKQNLDMNLALYQENQDSFDKMQGIYKDAFVAHVNSLEKQYTQNYNEDLAVGKMMIDYPNAKILPSDTLAQATLKVQSSGGNTSSQVIGSADTGYQLLTTDSQGNKVSITPISGTGGGGKKLSASIQSDLNDDLASISTLGSREKALIVLNGLKTSAINKYGQENYNLLISEVDRLYPAGAVKPIVPVTAYSSGQSVGGVVKPLYEAFRPENLGAGIKSVSNTVGSFFSGLFGG